MLRRLELPNRWRVTEILQASANHARQKALAGRFTLLAALLLAPGAAAWAETPWFVERAHELGLRFVHEPGARGAYYMPEILGSGAALFDADGDGDLDVYALDAGDHGKTTVGLPPHSQPAEPAKKAAGRNRLWRQDADGSFVDISDGSGLDVIGFATGVAIGDIDRDGLNDVYIAQVGRDILLRNLGDGSFEDITKQAGLGRIAAWSTSALFFDYDSDGFSDLFVVHYLDYMPALACSDQLGRADYCGPGAFAATVDRLYRNEGGVFRDVTVKAGLSRSSGRGLGVVAADFDDDGRLDLYVANDGQANRLWLQESPGSFVDRGLESGAAVNAVGRPEAGMGVAVGDVNDDGLLDLFVSHLQTETNTLYRAEQGLGFIDRSTACGLATPSLPFTGFGTAFADLDLDGDLDLLVTNGGVTRGPTQGKVSEGPFAAYAQQNQLYRNDGSGHFQPQDAGTLTDEPSVGRALVTGDVDDDGDVDLVLTSVGGPLRFFENQLERPEGLSWLQVAVREGSGALAPHARVTLEAEGHRWSRETRRAQGYLASHDPRVSFGLGMSVERIESLEVKRAGGRLQQFLDLPPNRRLEVLP